MYVQGNRVYLAKTTRCMRQARSTATRNLRGITKLILTHTQNNFIYDTFFRVSKPINRL